MEQTLIPPAEQERELSKAEAEAEMSPLAAASSPQARALRLEIIAVGRKLWERQYVDGNGGNISVRLHDEQARHGASRYLPV